MQTRYKDQFHWVYINIQLSIITPNKHSRSMWDLFFHCLTDKPHLVNLQLFTMCSTVSCRTHSLPTVRWHHSLHATCYIIIASPRQSEPTVKHGLCTTVSNLIQIEIVQYNVTTKDKSNKSTKYRDPAVCSCRHSKTSALVRSMYCVCRPYCVQLLAQQDISMG